MGGNLVRDWFDMPSAPARYDSNAVRCELSPVYPRQGSWSFIPECDLNIPLRLALHSATLPSCDGDPHQVEWLFQSKDPGRRSYARGRVSREGDVTLHLKVWHRVVHTSEPSAGRLVYQNRYQSRLRTSLAAMQGVRLHYMDA